MKTRTKRHICEAIGCLCWILFFGIVGGMDMRTISMGAGAAWAVILLGAGTLSLYKAGWIKI